MGYKAAHKAVALKRGKASDRFCSTGRCSRVAAEWSLNLERAGQSTLYENGHPYSLNIYDYDALCRVCHRMNDGNPYSD